MTANTETLLQPLCDFLESELKGELERQGHVATGRLRDSIKVAVLKSANGLTIEGKGSEISKYVDWGRKPGGKRVPIQALVGWIQVKGIASGKRAVQIAWAVQYSIWKNGIPTNKDEGKKMFVSRTLEKNKDKIFSEVRNFVDGFYNIELSNIIREVRETNYSKY
jgi:hypothetical protein